MRKSWDPERAPSLQYVMQAGWFLSSRPGGTTHGSPHAYDSHVPLLFWGRGVSAVGARPERVEIADLAPTLAGLLALPAPAQAQGRNLQLR
jgi:arylsulfatase A-like enzyme